ncbi:MAG: hypothetical protein HRU34_01100 [Richelia sp.]|nr:hypothetical protein [Richelia sp.]CDN12802.1 hypothetical protein RintRC_0763 [Richelia intracellularis]
MLENYKYLAQGIDLIIKIVVLSLEGSICEPIIDIKVRNTGSQPAF